MELQKKNSERQQHIYVNSVKVVGIHDSSLKEFDLSKMPLKQTFQLQVWLFSTNRYTHIHISYICRLHNLSRV